MSDDQPATVTQREYAKSRGVTAGAIWQAVEAGRIPSHPGGRINPEEADATWYRRHQQNLAARALSPESEGRREHALLTSTVAKLQMTRRRAEQLRAGLVERDREQAAIAALIDHLLTGLPRLAADPDPVRAALLREAMELVAADLGDLHQQALKIADPR